MTSITLPPSIPQCGFADLTWSGSVAYPARVEFYYQLAAGSWNSTGQVWDVYSSPLRMQVNIPSGYTMWATLVDNSGQYMQTQSGTAITVSDDESCIWPTFEDSPNADYTTTATLPAQTVYRTTVQLITMSPAQLIPPDVGTTTTVYVGEQAITPSSSTTSLQLSSTMTRLNEENLALSKENNLLAGVLGSFLALAVLLNFLLLFLLLKKKQGINFARRFQPAILPARTMTMDSDADSINPRRSMETISFSQSASVGHNSSLHRSRSQGRPVSQMFYLNPTMTNSQEAHDRMPSLSRSGTAQSAAEVYSPRNLYATNPNILSDSRSGELQL